MVNRFNWYLFLLLYIASVGSFAADVAIVNGQVISQEMLAANIASNVGPDQKESPELKKAVLEELVNRQLLVQRAETTGLTKTQDARLAIKQIRENYEAGLAIADYISNHPITETDIRADYDRQVIALGGSQAQQIKLSLIALPTQIEAEDAIVSLKKKTSFETLARDRSIAQSKTQGGLVGWVVLAQLPAEFSSAVASLSKGTFTTEPIQKQGVWYVLKLDDKRPFKIPSYKESREAIVDSLMQQRREALIQGLRASSEIVYDN